MKKNRNESGMLSKEKLNSDAVKNHRSREERVADKFQDQQQSQKSEQQNSCCTPKGDHKNSWQSSSGDCC